MEILDFVIVVICGFGIGILSGLFGIGGGGMIVPLLHLAFGLPILEATSTSLLTIAPTGISGSIKHLRQKTASLKVGLAIGGFGAVASIGGAFLASMLPDFMIVLLTVIVMLFSVGIMVRTTIKDKHRERESERKKAEALIQNIDNRSTGVVAVTDEEKEKLRERKEKVPLLLLLIVGLVAGLIAGIVGVGGGFIVVPFCVAYLGFTLKKASGTSLVAIAVLAIPGIISHTALGHISWFYGIAIIIGTVPGAQLGAWLIALLPERPMRLAFAGLLTIIGLFMLAQEFLF